MFNIEDELKKLPNNPGVYIMRDKQDKIIYVGKAINLKKRVTSYFRNTNKSPRILKMVSLIDHFEYIIVKNENEALILESNLIKENRPRFNVLLKDDKSYPFIKVDKTKEFESIYLTRKVVKDGSKYYGPYSNVAACHEVLNFIHETYPLVMCKNFKKRSRPCLNYHIGRCMGPCFYDIDKEKYKGMIHDAILILEGNTKQIEKELEDEMLCLSSKMEFEKAAIVRDKLNKVKQFSQKQIVSNINENSIDVIGIAKSDIDACIEVFFVRGSKMVGREHFFIRDLVDMDNSDILSGFINQYYINNPNVPKKIMVQDKVKDKNVLEDVLSKQTKTKIEIKEPKKGEKLKFVEMAINNAKLTLENKYKDKNQILSELQEVLNMDIKPRKIEAYDISNISGSFIVGAMCVLEDGIVKKNLTRRFKIKTVENKQDDVSCMIEVVMRRIKQSLKDPKGGFGNLPDVIFADGGLNQIHAIQKALELTGVDIKVFGMVKNDKHQTKALLDDKGNELKISNHLKNVITNFQDEVHNSAIEYHRKLRDKMTTKSKLDEIPGIGTAKKKALLKKFKTISNIKNQKPEDLVCIKGINLKLAKKILEVLNED